MTTIGVPVRPREPVLPRTRKMPLYSYPHPRNIHIAPNSHVFYPGNFDTERVEFVPKYSPIRRVTQSSPTLYQKYPQRRDDFDVNKYTSALHKAYGMDEELRKQRLDWSRFLDRTPERYNIPVPPLPPSAELPYVGYSFRYLQPDARVKHLPRQEPEFSQFARKPIDAFQTDQYRNLNSFQNNARITPPWRVTKLR